MPLPNLSDAAIRSHTTPEVFERGQDYVARGAVTNLVQRGNLLSAAVEGSQYEDYRVEVTFDTGGIVQATCTCPYDWGGWCKHIVAVVLACRAAPDQIEQRPPLTELLRPLNRDQLHDIILALAQRIPNVIEPLEHEVLRQQTATETAHITQPAPPQRRTAVDTRSYQRQAEAIVGAVHGMHSGMDIYYYTSAAVNQMEELIAQAHTFTENGDGYNALRILAAITEPYVNHWFEMDDSDGEAGDIFLELGKVWAEAVLTADLTRDEREDWQGKLEYWQAEVEDYGIDIGFEPAIAAAQQGWDDPLMVAMLRGDTTQWDNQADPLDEIVSAIIEVRLNVLERQGRTEEFLNLARVSGALPRYATMLVHTGRMQEAVQTGLTSFARAADAFTLATTLRDHGDLDAALRVATHGLTLAEPRAQLAVWLRDVAQQQGQHTLALQAAEVAFRSAPSLQTYHSVRDLAGAEWECKRPELLNYLRKERSALFDQKIDIFLHERLIDDAIAVVESGYTYGILDRVLEAAAEQRPDWVIQMGKRHAEQIINEGKAKYYDVAVRRLALVRRAYLHAGRANEWQRYETELHTTHGRKRKLMELLRQMKAHS